jgi:hypothetical protein
MSNCFFTGKCCSLICDNKKRKGLFAVKGTYCNYNKETGELEPDC